MDLEDIQLIKNLEKKYNDYNTSLHHLKITLKNLDDIKNANERDYILNIFMLGADFYIPSNGKEMFINFLTELKEKYEHKLNEVENELSKWIKV